MERDIIGATKALTIAGLFEERVRRTPDAEAYGEISKEGELCTYTWIEMAKKVEQFVCALAAEKAAGRIPQQASVGILLPNCTDWVAIDIAAHTLGISVVPLHLRDHPENWTYIVENAPIRVLFTDTWEQWNCIRVGLSARVSKRIQRVVTRTPFAKDADGHVISFDHWIDKESGRNAAVDVARVQKRPERIATICYTSGTTGMPKGAVLTNRNILCNAEGSAQAVPLSGRDRLLSFLPLSHMFERAAGYYVPMAVGASVVFARSHEPEILREDLKIARPTALISVPTIFDRIYEHAQGEIEKKPVFVRNLFETMVNWGMWLHGADARNEWIPGLHGGVAPLRAILFGKIRKALGGRLRFVVIGGARLDPKVARFFIGGGIPLLQGYGLTETGPVISVNRIDDNRLESVGLPIQGTRVKLSENNELLVKSESIMMGYWKNFEATRKVIDSSGWLYTGDRAKIINEHIYIKGRADDMIVLSNGKNVWPETVEEKIKESPFVENAMVFLGKSKGLEAIVLLRAEYCQYINDPSGHLSAEIKKRVSEAFPFVRLKGIRILINDAWTVENGLLTPTLKLKRRKIVKAYT